MQGWQTGPILAPTPLPAALLAEAREHREAIAAALTADAHGPPSAGADTNEWGFTPAERQQS